MILHDGMMLDDGSSYQQKMFDRAAVLLQKFPFRFLNRVSRENADRSSNSRKMAFYYSKRFPNMCTSSSFYDDIMNIAEMHVNYYQSRWFDFGELYSEPCFNESTVPWTNRPLLRPIHSQNTFVHSVNYNYNNNQRDLTNSHTLKVQLPNKLVTILVPTPSSVESFSASSSPLDFEEPITPIKVMSKNNNDYKRSPEENNNKIHVLEDDDTKNSSIDSDSSRSDTTIDEKTVSYAEIIKYSKPTKPKQSEKPEYNIIEESKRESVKSNRIPPSKKISIKLPDAPFLPNNQHCAFCKNNGEEESVYRTHFVKDELGNVKCPFLSRYTCPHCKATGTKAHTISRCPLSNKNRINKFNKQQ
uniref:Nanos 3 n=1 Tax=Schizaphis graminum TaxID=13262 RepID=A0A2S2PMA9_SCHGA